MCVRQHSADWMLTVVSCDIVLHRSLCLVLLSCSHLRTVMQFGKVGKHKFTLDCKYPLSPMQAFAIAITGVDTKIVCD